MARIDQKRERGRKILGALALLFILLGLYWGLVEAPPDVNQGEAYRIIYLHLPIIFSAYLSFIIVFVGSCLFLWKGERRDDILAYSAVEIGVLFTALILITGIIWGKTTWWSPGQWWTWDPRLTLTAIHFFIFVGYLMLRALIDDEKQGAACGAVLGLIAPIDLFFIHMSVYWWPALHQPPSILQPDKLPWENIHLSILLPVIVNIIAFILLSFYLLSLRVRLAEMQENIKRLKLYGET